MSAAAGAPGPGPNGEVRVAHRVQLGGAECRLVRGPPGPARDSLRWRQAAQVHPSAMCLCENKHDLAPIFQPAGVSEPFLQYQEM